LVENEDNWIKGEKLVLAVAAGVAPHKEEGKSPTGDSLGLVTF